jgi:hypothetical protein
VEVYLPHVMSDAATPRGEEPVNNDCNGGLIPCAVTRSDGSTGVLMVPYEDWKRAARDAGIIDND